MKKKLLIIVFLVIVSIFTTNISFGATTTDSAQTITTTNAWDSEAGLKRVNAIGTKLLSANKLPTSVTFKVSDEDEVNAYANINNEIYVYKGLLNNVSNDDELAAVISHELGHIINSHCAKQTVINTVLANTANRITNEKAAVAANIGIYLTSQKISRTDEFEADLTGVDLLIAAGYNPLGMVSVLNKICGNYIDIIESHPSGDKRTMNIYDYLTYNYSDIVKKGYTTDSYKSFLNYATPIVTARNSNSRSITKFNNEQEKIRQNKLKKAKQYTTGKTSGWTNSYAVLQALSGS